jgi:hypothetical protein
LVAEDLAERLHDLQIAQSTAPDESDEILAKPESDKETADSTLKESIVQKNGTSWPLMVLTQWKFHVSGISRDTDEGRRDDEESVAQASVPQPVAQVHNTHMRIP